MDSKAPLAAYLAALKAPTKALAPPALPTTRQIGGVSSILSARSYWARLTCTPEFVVLFLPGEVSPGGHGFGCGVGGSGVSRRVIVASPTTLIACELFFLLYSFSVLLRAAASPGVEGVGPKVEADALGLVQGSLVRCLLPASARERRTYGISSLGGTGRL